MSDQTDDVLLADAAEAEQYLRHTDEDTAADCMASLAASLRASREQVATLQEALAEAAREIPCAGPVAHRIRVLRQEHAATVARLTEENDRLRSLEALHAKQADAANGEVARLTAEKQALVEGKVWPIFKGDDHEDGLPPCAFRTIVDGRWTDFATPDEALTAERDDARAALDRLAETIEQMPRIGFNSTRDSIGPYLRRSAVLEAVRSAARLGSDSEDPTHG